MIEKTSLNIGDRVRFGNGAAAWKTWVVKAVDGRFAVLTRLNGEQYTILDWERGLRGPCNRIGQGWDCKGDGAAELLRELLTDNVEVSHRNNVPIEITWQRGPRGNGPDFGAY